MMTYLDAINRVLRRLREDEVASVTSTTYAKLVGDYINDAVRLVEDSWDWSALRTTVSIATAQSQFSLHGVTSQFKTLNVINETEKCFMNLGTQTELQKVKYIDPITPSAPTHYVYGGAFSHGVLVDVYPVPDKTYTLQFNIVNRSDELTDRNDNIMVPYLPVIQFATAMAAEERGETGGASAQALYSMAKSTLSDAISMDAARFPTETIWYSV